MRIETTPHRSPEKSLGCLAARNPVEPFSRSGNRLEVPRSGESDRMFRAAVQRVTTMLRTRPSNPPSCYRAAYDAVIAKHSAGIMPTHFPYRDKYVAVHVDNGIVQLRIDPADPTKNPCMTHGPGGEMTHDREISAQECILLATALWGVATSDSILF